MTQIAFHKRTNFYTRHTLCFQNPEENAHEHETNKQMQPSFQLMAVDDFAVRTSCVTLFLYFTFLLIYFTLHSLTFPFFHLLSLTATHTHTHTRSHSRFRHRTQNAHTRTRPTDDSIIAPYNSTFRPDLTIAHTPRGRHTCLDCVRTHRARLMLSTRL